MERLTNGQDLIKKLRLENKVEILNKLEHLKEIEKIDKSMEKLNIENYPIIPEDFYYPMRYSE